MRRGSVFSLLLGNVAALALAACSAPATPPPQPPAAPPPPPPVDAAIDAPPSPGLRGEACSPERACSADLSCADAPGGYCTSACGLAGTVCPDGTCVATARSGELCQKRCERDSECRVAEGYLCDPQWKACMIPNTAVIVPKQCPVPRGPARDAAFGASRALSSAATAGLSQRGPSAIVTDAGDVLALFDSRRGPLDAGQLGSAIAGASGVRPTGFPASEGDRSDVQVARDRKGIFYAVWLEVEGRHRQIALARSRDGGRTWTGPHPVDAADCDDQDRACLDRPMIAIGAAAPSTGNDLVHVFYAAGGGLRVATSLDEGATFRAPITAVPGHHGTATVGPDGRIHAVVLDPATSLPGFGSADHRVLYTVSTDNGRSFARAQKLSGRDEILPYFGARPSVAVDPRRGYVYAAYVRGGRDAVWDLVLLASKDRGKTWKRTTIGDGCSIHMIPTLALDPATGVLHVAWYEPRGFAHAACKAGLASCTPLGAINDVPFASLSLERDAPRSLGESATLLVDDRRRTLHAVWTQPVDEQGKVVARIFHAQAKLPRK